MPNIKTQCCELFKISKFLKHMLQLGNAQYRWRDIQCFKKTQSNRIKEIYKIKVTYPSPPSPISYVFDKLPNSFKVQTLNHPTTRIIVSSHLIHTCHCDIR